MASLAWGLLIIGGLFIVLAVGLWLFQGGYLKAINTKIELMVSRWNAKASNDSSKSMRFDEAASVAVHHSDEPMISAVDEPFEVDHAANEHKVFSGDPAVLSEKSGEMEPSPKAAQSLAAKPQSLAPKASLKAVLKRLKLKKMKILFEAASSPSIEGQAPGVDQEVVDQPIDPNLVVFYLVKSFGPKVKGNHLHSTLVNKGMMLNEQGAFVVLHEQQTVFQVLNGKKPGYFDGDQIHHKMFDSLVFVMELPYVDQPKAAFRKMLGMLHEVAIELNLDILNGHRKPLTQRMVEDTLRRIKQYHGQQQREMV